jgi:teichuronic acid biosynthesis glycosyltransferase TuaG
MSLTPSMSVVVTSYNAEKYIELTLNSVLSQTLRAAEVIVVDDASEDGTCALVDKTLRGRIPYRLLRLPSNTGGPGRPRNIGVEMATAEWVALLDSDDVWHPRKTEIQLSVAGQYGSVFVSSEKRVFRYSDEAVKRSNESLVTPVDIKTITYKSLFQKNIVCTSSVISRRDLLLRHPFSSRKEHQAIEDYRCWLDLHKQSVKWHPQVQTPLVFYRLSDNSISTSKIAMIQKNWRLYRDYFDSHSLSLALSLAAMTRYGIASIYRHIQYKSSRC